MYTYTVMVIIPLDYYIFVYPYISNNYILMYTYISDSWLLLLPSVQSLYTSQVDPHH